MSVPVIVDGEPLILDSVPKIDDDPCSCCGGSPVFCPCCAGSSGWSTAQATVSGVGSGFSFACNVSDNCDAFNSTFNYDYYTDPSDRCYWICPIQIEICVGDDIALPARVRYCIHSSAIHVTCSGGVYSVYLSFCGENPPLMDSIGVDPDPCAEALEFLCGASAGSWVQYRYQQAGPIDCVDGSYTLENVYGTWCNDFSTSTAQVTFGG